MEVGWTAFRCLAVTARVSPLTLTQLIIPSHSCAWTLPCPLTHRSVCTCVCAHVCVLFGVKGYIGLLLPGHLASEKFVFDMFMYVTCVRHYERKKERTNKRKKERRQKERKEEKKNT